jgi:hypothetical protein
MNAVDLKIRKLRRGSVLVHAGVISHQENYRVTDTHTHRERERERERERGIRHTGSSSSVSPSTWECMGDNECDRSKDRGEEYSTRTKRQAMMSSSCPHALLSLLVFFFKKKEF